jgi:hypothetical protein
MRQINKIIVHCTATPEGREVNKLRDKIEADQAERIKELERKLNDK